MTGCTQISAGCDNCYALTLANRLLKTQYTSVAPANPTAANSEDPFAVRVWRERLTEPAKWKSPRRVFVNSMGDLFHVDVPDSHIRDVFRVMLSANTHIYQVLTKRPARMERFIRRNMDMFDRGMVPKHIWLGTSVENQKSCARIRQLQRVPATVRFLSCEPLLGPIAPDLDGIHWVIAGGESGVTHRKLKLDWVRSLRDVCAAGHVPFFFKQVGGRTPKAGGRQLDGKTWSQYPNIALGSAL